MRTELKTQLEIKHSIHSPEREREERKENAIFFFSLALIINGHNVGAMAHR